MKKYHIISQQFADTVTIIAWVDHTKNEKRGITLSPLDFEYTRQCIVTIFASELIGDMYIKQYFLPKNYFGLWT